jgi:hypothetical protein
MSMAKASGIYERKGKSGDVTYYIRYQVDGTDIKERVGRKSRGFTREMAKDALKSRLGDLAQGTFQAGEGAQAGAVFEAGGARQRVCGRLQTRLARREVHR